MSGSIANRLSLLAAAMGNDARQVPRLARLAGFKGLLFDVWSSMLSIPDLSASGRRDFLGMLATDAQQLVALRIDLGPNGLSIGADVDKQIARLNQAIQSSAELQSPLLCVDLGPLPQPQVALKPSPTVKPQDAGLIIIPTLQATPTVAQSPPPDPAAVSQVSSALVEIGQLADRYSMTLALSTSLASFAALQQAIVSANCPWFGIDLDTVAILRDVWTQDEIFSALGPLIRHVRARDAIIGADHRTKPALIGRGSINWRELLAALDDSGYRGFFTIDPLELPDRAAAAK
ncbi:MAG TPA: TIM barrel protein, partial [Tepidisphaeraceae bacterium]|nr:TIM barrel protein [Tepidisphaeraceae bacterium]